MGDRCEPTLCGGPAQAKRSCSRWLLTSACAVADCAAAACKFVPAWRAVTNDTAYIVMEGVTWGDDDNARPCRRAGAGRQPRGAVAAVCCRRGSCEANGASMSTGRVLQSARDRLAHPFWVGGQGMPDPDSPTTGKEGGGQ